MLGAGRRPQARIRITGREEARMDMFGGDTVGMRRLAERFEFVAQRLVAMEQSVGGKLNGTDWTGPDADRYREQWTGHRAQALLAASRDLAQAAVNMKGDADRQDQASGSSW